MANTNKIKLKRSAIAGRIPTITDVDLGELAMNTADGKLYMKKDDGKTQSIMEINKPGGDDKQIQFNDGGSFGGNASLTFDGSTKTLSVGEAPGLSVRTTVDGKVATISLYDDATISSNIIFNSDNESISITAQGDLTLLSMGKDASSLPNSLVVGSPGINAHTHVLSVGDKNGLSIRTIIKDESTSLVLHEGNKDSSSIVLNSSKNMYPNAISIMGLGGVAIGEKQGNSLVIGSPGISAPQQTINMIDALDNALVTKEWVQVMTVVPTTDLGFVTTADSPSPNPVAGDFYTAGEDGNYVKFVPPIGGLVSIMTDDTIMWDGFKWRISLIKKLLDLSTGLKAIEEFGGNTGWKFDDNKTNVTGMNSVNLTVDEEATQDAMVYVDGVKYTGYKTADLPDSELGTTLYDSDRNTLVMCTDATAGANIWIPFIITAKNQPGEPFSGTLPQTPTHSDFQKILTYAIQISNDLKDAGIYY